MEGEWVGGWRMGAGRMGWWVTGVDEGQEHIPGVKFCGSERTAPWIFHSQKLQMFCGFLFKNKQELHRA